MAARNLTGRTFLYPGAENLLALLHPHGGKNGRGEFPKGWNQTLSRNSAATPGEWFVDCVNALGIDPEYCTIDPSIAIFGVTRWEQETELTYACVHALVAVDTTVEHVYSDPSLPAQYFRLEADRSQPGPIFKEAFPHVHVHLDGAPRFSIGNPDRPHVLQEFIEFLYRNYRHDAWVQWAREAYEARVCERAEDIANFNALVDAYNKGSREKFVELKQVSASLRVALARELADACALRISIDERTLIDYP